MKVDIGKHIREQRERLGLTQSQVAKIIGFQPTTISNYESGRTIPTVDIVDKLSNVLTFDFFSLYRKDSPDLWDEIQNMKAEIEHIKNHLGSLGKKAGS